VQDPLPAFYCFTISRVDNRTGEASSLVNEEPPHGLSAPLLALWWDAKQDWSRSHAFVDELETTDGMAVHAHLHRKGGNRQMRTIGTSVLGADFAGPHLMKNGRR
jgi:hypothetical protein